MPANREEPQGLTHERRIEREYILVDMDSAKYD